MLGEHEPKIKLLLHSPQNPKTLWNYLFAQAIAPG